MNNTVIGYMICESATTVSDIDIVSKGNRVIAKGRVQTADEVNRNRRIYTEQELFPQLTCDRTNELLAAGYLRAESGHPMSKDLTRQQTIDPSNVCAQFLKFWTEGKDVMATFKGTNNALGEFFNADLLDGCKPAWSLRALGSIENTRRGAEVRNLKIITYDHVIYPSHPGAYTTGIVNESGMAISSIPAGKDATKSYILPFTNQSVIDYIKTESANIKLMRNYFDVLATTICMIDESHVSMTDADGNTLVMYLEDYIGNEIMNYCNGK